LYGYPNIVEEFSWRRHRRAWKTYFWNW